MSLLTDFAQAQFQQARSIIGAEDITVGTGDPVSGVISELVTSHDEYDAGGFPLVESCAVVVSLGDWTAAYPGAATSYLKKTATLRGQTLRVERISTGQGFVFITLKIARKG